MPELGPSGSVRGALSNERPYRDVRRETGKEYVVKDPMGVWIATGALGRVRSLNHPLWRRPCKLQLT